MQIDESSELGRRVLHALLEAGELLAHARQCRLETGNLLVHQTWGDDQMRHLEGRVRHEVCLTDRDTTGNR